MTTPVLFLFSVKMIDIEINNSCYFTIMFSASLLTLKTKGSVPAF